MSSVPVSFVALPFRAVRAFGLRTTFTVACLALLCSTLASAQNAPGTLDPTFNSFQSGNTFYTQVLLDIDGAPAVFVGGDRAAINVLDLNGAFNPDFVLPNFGNVIRIIYTAVPEQILQAGATTPYLLLGGQFGRSALQVRAKTTGQNIVRLTPAGALDTTFDPGTGANNFVTSILPLYNGDMIVAGLFDEFNGQSRQRIVRLNNQGKIVDNSVFASALSFDAGVLSLAPQNPYAPGTAPQVLAAGLFSNVNGATHQKLVRFNPDGSVDASFNPSFDDRTTVVVSQPDGKILVGGDFNNVNGKAANHVVRLNYDGSIDSTFTASVTGVPSGFSNPPAVYVIQLLNDGSMYLGGNFTTVNGVRRNYLARVDANGALDTVFDPRKTIINAVQSLVIQPNGQLLVGETLSKTNEDKTNRPSLIRLNAEPPVITLVASDSTAVVASGNTGAFTITRSGTVPNSGPLSVPVQLSGNAVPGKNYDALQFPGGDQGAGKDTVYSVVIPAGESSVTIPVVPTQRVIKNNRVKRVVLTLVNDPAQQATVTISN